MECVLTKEEIESLLGIDANVELSARSADDLREIRLQLAAIPAKLSNSLSALLRTSVKVELDGVDSHFYGDCIKSIEGPTCCAFLRASSWQNPGMLIIDAPLVLPMVDRLLGGTGTSPAPLNRALTEIESKLMRRILDAFVTELRNEWESSLPIDVVLEQVEGSEQLLQELPFYVQVAAIRFELVFGEANGLILLCLPWSLLDALKNQRESKPEEFDGNDVASDQTFLHIGDVLSTEIDPNGQLVVFINGMPQFHAAEELAEGRSGMRLVARLS